MHSVQLCAAHDVILHQFFDTTKQLLGCLEILGLHQQLMREGRSCVITQGGGC